tara:strand:- start:86552 stop:88561 length:2010 start_codon:yes stop_codon:yes gene_type:complete
MSDEQGTDTPHELSSESVNDALLRAMQCTNEDDWTGAVDICKQTISSNPTAAEPYFVLAVIAFRAGDEAQAIEMAETAHQIDPDTREYAQILGAILARVGRLADGAYYSKLAEINEPHIFLSTVVPEGLIDFQTAAEAIRPSGHGVESARRFNVGDFETALREAMIEVRINTGDASAYLLVAKAALVLGRYGRALGAAQAAVRLDPESVVARGYLARALNKLGRYDEAASAARTAMAMAPEDAEVYAVAMHVFASAPDADVDDLKAIAADFAAAFAADNADNSDVREKLPSDAPPHVGFISNGFFRCPIGEMLLPWFGGYDPRSARVSGYQQSVADDTVTTALRNGVNHWRPVFDVDSYTMAHVLQTEALDVLVDVSSIEFDTRVTLAALNPCPVRVGVSTLPEPGLAPGITHVLTDETMATGDQSMLLDGQALITVPGTLFAHEPYRSLPQDEKRIGVEGGVITFGALASLPEVSARCAEVWARILRAIPGSRLMMIDDGKLGDDRRTRLREYFMNAGIVDHVVFAAADPASAMAVDAERGLDPFKTMVSADHWRSIDVLLDTFPINCGVAVREALWSGVPTITLAGTRRAGRIGASILAGAKLTKWIAETPDEYVETAISLGTDLEVLRSESQALLNNVAATPLFDAQSGGKAVRDALMTAARQSRS